MARLAHVFAEFTLQVSSEFPPSADIMHTLIQTSETAMSNSHKTTRRAHDRGAERLAVAEAWGCPRPRPRDTAWRSGKHTTARTRPGRRHSSVTSRPLPVRPYYPEGPQLDRRLDRAVGRLGHGERNRGVFMQPPYFVESAPSCDGHAECECARKEPRQQLLLPARVPRGRQRTDRTE